MEELKHIVWEEGLYEGLTAIRKALDEQAVSKEVKEAIDAAINIALTDEQSEFERNLTEAMYHVIVAKYYPKKFSETDHFYSRINQYRDMCSILLKTDAINKEYVESVWDECVDFAIPYPPREDWANERLKVELSWEEVFEYDWIDVLHPKTKKGTAA